MRGAQCGAGCQLTEARDVRGGLDAPANRRDLRCLAAGEIRFIWLAALAGAKTCPFSVLAGRVKADIVRAWRRRAAPGRSAVNTGRRHRIGEVSIEAALPQDDGLPPRLLASRELTKSGTLTMGVLHRQLLLGLFEPKHPACTPALAFEFRMAVRNDNLVPGCARNFFPRAPVFAVSDTRMWNPESRCFPPSGSFVFRRRNGHVALFAMRPLAAAMSLVALGGTVFFPGFAPALAEMTVEVGGAPMYPSKTIIENAVNSKDHTTLVAAIKAADLAETLQGDGPFTVFAPVNKAFEKLPKGTLETLLQPENKQALTAVLTYHLILGQNFRRRFCRGCQEWRRRGHLQDRRGRGADREAEQPQARDH